MSRPVVFATDFSENSLPALEYASTLAAYAEVPLHIVFVSEALPTPDNPSPAYHTPSAIIDAEVAAKQSMDAIKPTFPEVDCVKEILHGDAAKEIIDYADEQQAGVIVLGTHGRTGLLKLLMGSVAEKVVSEANRPVIVVKVPKQPPASDESHAAAD